MTTNEEARAALRRLEALHPTARIVVGQQTHGGPLQYGDGCDAHGMWCREWRIVRDSLAVIRDALAAAPDRPGVKEVIDFLEADEWLTAARLVRERFEQ